MTITIEKGELKSLIRETVLELLAEKSPQFNEYLAEAVEDALFLKVLRNEPKEEGMSFDTFLKEVESDRS